MASALPKAEPSPAHELVVYVGGQTLKWSSGSGSVKQRARRVQHLGQSSKVGQHPRIEPLVYLSVIDHG